MKDFVLSFVQSPEFKRKFVDGQSPQQVVQTLYQKLLNRTSDPSGHSYFSSRITVNGYEWVTQAMMWSPEYQNKFGSSQIPGPSNMNCSIFDTVTQAYCRIALRCPGDSDYTTNTLALGSMMKTTKQLLNELISSPAYASRLPPISAVQVRAMYLTLLNREPTPVEYQTDAPTVQQQSGYQALATKLFYSGEYIMKYGDWLVPGQDVDLNGAVYMGNWPPWAFNPLSGSGGGG